MNAVIVLRNVAQFQKTPQGERWKFLSQLTGVDGKSTRLMVFRQIEISDVLAAVHRDGAASRARAHAHDYEMWWLAALRSQEDERRRLIRRFTGLDIGYSVATAKMRAATLSSVLTHMAHAHALTLIRSEVVIDASERDLFVSLNHRVDQMFAMLSSATLGVRGSGELTIDDNDRKKMAIAADPYEYGTASRARRLVRRALRENDGKFLPSLWALPEIDRQDNNIALVEEALKDRANLTRSNQLIYVKG